MPGTQTRNPASIQDLFGRSADDPWSLTLEERADVARSPAAKHAQASWLDRLSTLVEPPALDHAFPAWLLDNEHFAELRESVGTATTRAELPTAAADELQRFVDLFRQYTTQLDPLVDPFCGPLCGPLAGPADEP